MSNLTGFVKRLRDIMRNDAGINGDAQRIEQIAWMLFLKVYDAKEQDWAFDEEGYVSIIPEPCRWENWAHDDKSGSALTGDPLLNFVNNTLFPVLKGNDVKDSNGKVLVEGIKVDANTPIKKAVVRTTFADANQYMKDGVLLRQVLNVIDELDLSDYEESHAFGEIYETILKELQSAGSAGEFSHPPGGHRLYGPDDPSPDWGADGRLRLRHRRLFDQLAERAAKAGEEHQRCHQVRQFHLRH